jgi:hypothetical protein
MHWYKSQGSAKSVHRDLNKLGVKLALSKDSSPVKLPPSEAAFRQHILRVEFQVYVWTHANEAKHCLSSCQYQKKDDVVSHPVREWATGKMFAISAPSELYRSCTGINRRPSFTDVMLPVWNQTISDSFLEMCSPVKFAHSLSKESNGQQLGIMHSNYPPVYVVNQQMVKRNSNGRILIKSSDNDVLLLSLRLLQHMYQHQN